jgi:hypothetical protein
MNRGGRHRGDLMLFSFTLPGLLQPYDTYHLHPRYLEDNQISQAKLCSFNRFKMLQFVSHEEATINTYLPTYLVTTKNR